MSASDAPRRPQRPKVDSGPILRPVVALPIRSEPTEAPQRTGCIRCGRELPPGLSIWCRRCRGEAAQALSEFALVLPLLLLILVGIIDVGTTSWRLLVWQQNANTSAELVAKGEAAIVPADCDTPVVTDDGLTIALQMSCTWASATTLLPGEYEVSATAVLP